MTESCYKCGERNKRLFRHHISYNPEKIILVCARCHKMIHNKINRIGSCCLSRKEIKKLSNKSVMNHIHKNTFVFGETMIKNVRLLEDIFYDPIREIIKVNSYFHANVNKRLFYLKEE